MRANQQWPLVRALRNRDCHVSGCLELTLLADQHLLLDRYLGRALACFTLCRGMFFPKLEFMYPAQKRKFKTLRKFPGNPLVLGAALILSFK